MPRTQSQNIASGLGWFSIGLGLAEVAAGGRVQLSATLAQLLHRERFLACELKGRRFDIGLKYGLLNAQLAFALSGKDRSEILSGMVELLAHDHA